MSIVTSKSSTILSILKTGENRLTNNRVRFKLPNNVRKIFMETKNGGDSRDYKDLVCTIRDCEISDDDLLELLEEARKCVSLLGYDMRLFVQALVILGWTQRTEKVVKAYQEFIIDLVSAHSQHSKVVIEQLVKLFLITEEPDWVDGVPSDMEKFRFDKCHVILRSIVRLIPLTQDMLLNAISTYYPYYTISSVKQQAFLYNTLKIIDYLPQCRREILATIIDRLLIIDTNAPREEILQSYNTEPLPMSDEPLEDVFDHSMLMLFRFIDKVCKPGDELRFNEAKSLFLDLMDIFDKDFLTTIGSCHVQFIIFYLCSLKQTFAQAFLNSLWGKVHNPSVAPVVRKTAVAYMASFLARAQYLPTGYLKTYLCELTEWCHKYVATRDTNHPSFYETSVHGVFYAVCQAIFYVIAFRHNDLVDSRKKLVFLQSLNLSKLVTCPLNPLRICSPAVVENFACVARDSQLAYCYTIMEQNSRNFLDNSSHIEPFFPFDPYVLKKSSSYITPLYLKYNSDLEDDEEDMVQEQEEVKERNGDEDEDDFISENRRLERSMDFSYSTSPGFK